MKKLLLGTTALVLLSGAAGAQQVTTSSPFTVTLGGSVRYDFAFFDEDVSNVNRESRMDTRIFLKAEAKADNGLTYGFDSRIRTAGGVTGNATGMVMDYKYIYAKGAWGTVNLGDYYGAATALEVVSPTVGIGQADLAAFASPGQAALFWATEDNPSTKITYLTPSFAGFQAGVSYTPEFDESGRSIRKTGIRNRDVVEVAGQYAGEFGPVGVTIGGGYEMGQSSSTLGDYELWNVGAQVAFSGFTVGANYYDNGEIGLDTTVPTTFDQQHTWAFGATYVTGPFGVGASYVRTTSQVSGTNDDQVDQVYGIGGAYKLAPGLSLQSDINYIDAETVNNKAWQLVLRTRVDF